MSMHTHRDHGYFDSGFDGSYWPALLVVGAMFALASVAWLTS